MSFVFLPSNRLDPWMPLRPSIFFPSRKLFHSIRLLASRPPKPMSDLQAEITALGDRISELKANKSPFADEVVKLKELKTQLPPPPKKTREEQQAETAAKSTKQKKGEGKGLAGQGRLQLKVPKVSSPSPSLSASPSSH